MNSSINKDDEDFALVPTNILVRRASWALRYKPQTLIRKIQQYMSSPVEQAIYIQIAIQFHHQPRVFKEILQQFMGHELRKCDLERTFD